MTDTLAWDDHYPSAVHGMDGYDYVSCSCGWDSDKPNSGWPEHIRAMGADSLDAAWAEAEAALPEGWAIDGLYRVVSRTSLEREWEVIVHEDDWQGDEDNHHGRGPTPAAALRSLAARLRERG